VSQVEVRGEEADRPGETIEDTLSDESNPRRILLARNFYR